MRIDGAGALVTGGASGLGRAVATLLASRGAKVVVFDLTGGDAAAETNVRYVSGDVRSEADVTRAVDAAVDLRIVVSCAGIATPGRIVRKGVPLGLEDFRRVVDVNLIGTFNVMRLAAARMTTASPSDGERGVIVNTASVAAFEGQIGQIAYAASKAGIAGMTICAARDLADSLIRVCAIAPGTFDTPLLAGLDDTFRAALGKAVPHPARLGRPEEFAQLALHIVENPMLNGETIRLDGALRMAPR